MVNPEFLSVKQAMTLIGVSRVTLHRWRAQGLLHAHKIGGRVLYLREEVMRALTTGTEPVPRTARKRPVRAR